MSAARKLDAEQLRNRLQDLRHTIDEISMLLDRSEVAEQALQQSEERFRMLIESVEEYAIFMLDVDGYISSWNPGAQRIKGYKASEIIGRHFSLFYPPEDLAINKPARALKIATEQGHYSEENWRMRKDGTRFWASVLITPIHDSAGTLRGFAKVTRDMTDRRIAEEALRQSEERFRLLVSGARDYAIFMLDVDGRISSWNLGAELIKGYGASEIIGQHFSLFYPPEDIAAGKPEREIEIATREGRYEEEGWRIRKDGTRFWANVVLTAVHDATGELRGFAKVTRDMTDRRMAEEARDQLRQRNHQLELEQTARAQVESELRSRDEFLIATAHELRTPVTALLGYSQLLRRRLDQSAPPGDRERRLVRAIVEQTQRINRLTTMLLEMNRLSQGVLTLNRATIDLRGELARVAGELETIAEHHMLALDMPDEPLLISADELSLEQIFYNLLHNALKYSPAGGTISIVARRDDEQAVVHIADQGLGIPADDLAQIFDRFYRAKNIDAKHISGLGLGLYIVKELVALHDGTISAHSAPGEGSTFTVSFPLSKEE